MTKTEIISRIIDRITDPWTESPEDYQYAEPIDLDSAKDVLKQYRDDDDDCDIEPDERMPKEATPALLMEAYNCNIRYQKHELLIRQFAKFITDNELVCEFDNYYVPEHESVINLIPIDFLGECNSLPFTFEDTHNPDYLTVLMVGMNSKDTFNPNDEYCWYDETTKSMHSTSTPFADGLLNAEAFARFILTDMECFDYIVNDIMTDEDANTYFKCSKENLKKEVFC